jgi:hypothetical protein
MRVSITFLSVERKVYLAGLALLSSGFYVRAHKKTNTTTSVVLVSR